MLRHRFASRLQALFAGFSVVFALVALAATLHRNGLWADELYTLHAINLPVREMVFERLARGIFLLIFC